MIGLDTGCVQRYLLRDHERQAKALAERIDAEIDAGHTLYINDIVLTEFVWTLDAAYDFDSARIAPAIERITTSAQVQFENKANVLAALSVFQSSQAGFCGLPNWCKESKTRRHHHADVRYIGAAPSGF